MSSCKRATEARVRLKPKDSAAIMNNPINSHPGKMCSCGKMCKNNRGLKIHQDKTKCQIPENNLVAPPQNVLCPCKMLFCHHASLLMIVSIIEHLTTPLFLSQTVRSQLLVTSVCTNERHYYPSFD